MCVRETERVCVCERDREGERVCVREKDRERNMGRGERVRKRGGRKEGSKRSTQ